MGLCSTRKPERGAIELYGICRMADPCPVANTSGHISAVFHDGTASFRLVFPWLINLGIWVPNKKHRTAACSMQVADLPTTPVNQYPPLMTNKILIIYYTQQLDLYFPLSQRSCCSYKSYQYNIAYLYKSRAHIRGSNIQRVNPNMIDKRKGTP